MTNHKEAAVNYKLVKLAPSPPKRIRPATRITSVLAVKLLLLGMGWSR